MVPLEFTLLEEGDAVNGGVNPAGERLAEGGNILRVVAAAVTLTAAAPGLSLLLFLSHLREESTKASDGDIVPLNVLRAQSPTSPGVPLSLRDKGDGNRQDFW